MESATASLTMATTPDRVPFAEVAARSLSGQCAELVIYLNGRHNGLPSIPNVRWVEGGIYDMADNGKFHVVPQAGYHLTVDDDLIYPAGYVAGLIAKSREHHDRAIVSLHGCNVEPPIGSYYRDRQSVGRCLYPLAADAWAMIPGTGTLCYRAGLIDLAMVAVGRRYMCDVLVGAAAQEQGVPVLVAAHAGGWLKYQRLPKGITIWERFHDRDGFVTDYINARSWRLNTL